MSFSQHYQKDNLPQRIFPTSKKFRNYSNEVHNNINILYPVDKNGDGKYLYLCQCYCGEYFKALPYRIISGNTKSCGCLFYKRLLEYNQRNRIDLINRTFGELKVLKSAGFRDVGYGNLEFWTCECSCGIIRDFNGHDLKRDKIQSCGCTKSRKEEEIANILKRNNISFVREYSFTDLFFKSKSYPLRFDFAIFNRGHILQYLIEYHGEQHYNKLNPWYSEECKTRDALKENYCEDNKIPLIILTIKDDISNLTQIIKEKVGECLCQP